MHDGKVGCDTVELQWSMEGWVEYWTIDNSFPAFWLAVFSMAWYKSKYYTAPKENKINKENIPPNLLMKTSHAFNACTILIIIIIKRPAVTCTLSGLNSQSRYSLNKDKWRRWNVVFSGLVILKVNTLLAINVTSITCLSFKWIFMLIITVHIQCNKICSNSHNQN